MPKRFYVEPLEGEFQAPRTKTSYFILSQQPWDDYGSKSLYVLKFIDGVDENTIGEIKVIESSSRTAALSSSFDNLQPNFLSLGQTLSFYRKLREYVGKDGGKAVLEALNDASAAPGLQADFENLAWFQNSLLRSNEAQRCLLYGLNVLQGRGEPETSSFVYNCDLKGADEEVRLNFNFDSDDRLPNRICALIGRNGVGKTSMLAQLALDLTDVSRLSSTRRQQREDQFEGNRPIFSRVIAFSFSAFDEFRRPTPSPQISYIYCGVKDDKGRVSRANLLAKHRSFFNRLVERGKLHSWRDYVSFILGQDADIKSYETYLSGDLDDEGETKTLSSGQNTLIYCVSALLAYAKKDSLILFDEPEVHLHPNAIAQLMMILSDVLKRLECRAILATHSALVLQEIPSKRVTYLRRTGNLTLAHPLGQETFGEDISLLNEVIFETLNVDYVYKDVLDRLARRQKFNEVLELFDGRLGFHAMSYLRSRYPDE